MEMALQIWEQLRIPEQGRLPTDGASPVLGLAVGLRSLTVTRVNEIFTNATWSVRLFVPIKQDNIDMNIMVMYCEGGWGM